jgi:hypothetical protein
LETVSGVWIVDQFVYSWVVQGKFLILDWPSNGPF